MLRRNILYFYNSNAEGFDLAEEEKKAGELGACSRDVAAYMAGDFLEACEGVCGDAPESYVVRFGRVDDKRADPAPSSSKQETTGTVTKSSTAKAATKSSTTKAATKNKEA